MWSLSGDATPRQPYFVQSHDAHEAGVSGLRIEELAVRADYMLIEVDERTHKYKVM